MSIKEKLMLIIAVVLLSVTSVITLYIPQVIRMILENLNTYKFNDIAQLGIVILILIILRLLTKLITLEFGFSIVKRIKSTFYESLIFKRYHVNKIGYYIDIYDRDFNIVERFISNDFINIFINSIIIIGVLFIFLNYSVLLAISSFVFIAVTFCSLYVYIRKSNDDIVTRTREVEKEYKNFILEMFKLSNEIISANKVSHVLEIISKKHVEIKDCNVKLQRYLYRLWILVLLIYNFTLSIALIIALGLVSSSKISVNEFYLLFLYVLMLKNPLEMIQSNLQSYIKFRESNKRIKNIISKGIDIDKVENISITKLSLNNVSKLVNDKVILNDVSCSINTGVYCFFGESGAGKTTLAKIISGVTDKASGEIIINDEVLATEDLLLKNSIYLENHSIGDMLLENLDVMSILNETDKSIVVIDEIFSDLSEEHIIATINQIRELCANKIIVIITHQPYFINLVDETYSFKEGELYAIT